MRTNICNAALTQKVFEEVPWFAHPGQYPPEVEADSFLQSVESVGAGDILALDFEMYSTSRARCPYHPAWRERTQCKAAIASARPRAGLE